MWPHTLCQRTWTQHSWQLKRGVWNLLVIWGFNLWFSGGGSLTRRCGWKGEKGRVLKSPHIFKSYHLLWSFIAALRKIATPPRKGCLFFHAWSLIKETNDLLLFGLLSCQKCSCPDSINPLLSFTRPPWRPLVDYLSLSHCTSWVHAD